MITAQTKQEFKVFKEDVMHFLFLKVLESVNKTFEKELQLDYFNVNSNPSCLWADFIHNGSLEHLVINIPKPNNPFRVPFYRNKVIKEIRKEIPVYLI